MHAGAGFILSRRGTFRLWDFASWGREARTDSPGDDKLIQSILFFSLGFLTAGFLALMVAPAIWRRAVALTRKRIEASVPLTMNEIQADKDRMRAEFAMSTRRLEMSIKSFREKAASQIIEINRNRDELRRLADERAEKDQALSALEARSAELRSELARREDEVQRMAGRIADSEQVLEQKALEIDKLGRMYDEAAMTSSARQIELVARESDFEKLSGDISSMRLERKDTEKRMRDAAAEAKTAQAALKTERRRSADLDRKVERLLATVADRDHRLERQDADLSRMREGARSKSSQSSDLDAKLTESAAERVRLEAELADMHLQMSTLLTNATRGDIEKAVTKLDAEKKKIDRKMADLQRENAQLKDQASEFQRMKTEDWDDERRGSALLREQINDLAAEVVNLTAMLDGPDSPIRKALDADTQAPNNGDRVISLADRVRALQKAAAAK